MLSMTPPRAASSLLTILFGCALYFSANNAYAEASRPVIEKKDDLPRHTYTITLPAATDLYTPEQRAQLMALASAIRSDIESDLETYDIRDDNTIQGFYGVLGSIALLEEDWQHYLELLEKRRALETKEANKLTMGLVGASVAQAQIAGDGSAEAVGEQLTGLIVDLPYEIVGANLEGLKGRTEILSRALVLGSIDSNYQPLIDNTDGEVSYDVAASLVSASFTLDYFLPVAQTVNDVLSATIAANAVEKEDIWLARQVTLEDDGNPVVLAIWDSGIDTQIFAALDQLWTNTEEIPNNGIDDDDNGYVDDAHGIAYDLHSSKVPDMLYPIGDVAEDELALQQMVKGLGDIQFNVDSEEASDVRKKMASLPQTEVQNFIESLGAYGNYSHGTHVAGIAAEGNPHARLLAARMTYGHEVMPELPTLAGAHRSAAMFLEVADYFRTHGVRVVNMSWGGSVRGIEQALEAHGAGGGPDERKTLAREIFQIGDAALRKAISESTDILWVTSAGNSDNNIQFDEFYPSSYDYPNLLTVGAVDLAGDETSFTSLGEVDVYGNGFEVDSYVPGGNRIPFNGTSMSSPQVVNLAGKILALYPDLSVAQLKAVIIEGADEKALKTRSIRLMNPRASMEIAASMQ